MNNSHLSKNEISDTLHQICDFLVQESQFETAKNINAEKDIANRLDMEKTKFNRQKNKGDRTTKLELLEKIRLTFRVNIKASGKFEFYPWGESSQIKLLAQKLAFNLVDVSTGFKERNKPHRKIIKNEVALANREKTIKRERIIAIIGAGASHAATGGEMPTANEAVKEIRSHINQETLIKRELKRLRSYYKMDSDNFETQLLACSRFAPDEVIEKLKEICEIEYFPSLFYEIIAHMLKHRFIDVVLNYNYDEILDNAIKEEISSGEYKHIFSDGHCPNKYKTLLIKDRLKQPIYIKPHGTISHQSSLRFTQENHFSLSPGIRRTIDEIIDAEVASEDYDYGNLPVNFLVFGFSMQSFELNDIIKDYLRKHDDKRITMWFFDLKRNKKEFKLDFSEEELARIDCHFIYPEIGKDKKELQESFLEKILLELWDKTRENFHLDYKPRGIERHLLINKIFKPSWKGYKANPWLNIRDRIYVELVISFLQSDGILNANQIIENRAGKFFHMYQEHQFKGKDPTTLSSFCDEIGLITYKDFVSDTYVLKEPNQFNDPSLFEFLFQKLLDCLSSTPRQALKDNKKDIIKLFEEIKGRNLLKITPNYIHPHNHQFTHLKKDQIFLTSLAWTYKFREFIEEKQNSWDVMLAISEKGRFLPEINNNKRQYLEGKKLELILASQDLEGFEDVSMARFKGINLVSGKPLFFPWWLHNQHLVLFLKRKPFNSERFKENFYLVKGFYFRSRMLTRHISPIHVKDQADLDRLLYIFANYWFRATQYTESKKSKEQTNIPIIKDRNEIDLHVENLLKKVDESKV